MVSWERLYMQPYRGLEHTYRNSDGLSTIPDDQNTLTHQSTDISVTPRDPIFTSPLYGILPVHGPTLHCGNFYVYIYGPGIFSDITNTTSTEPLRQEPAHRRIRYLTLVPSSALADLCWKPFPTGFNSLVL